MTVSNYKKAIYTFCVRINVEIKRTKLTPMKDGLESFTQSSLFLNEVIYFQRATSLGEIQSIRAAAKQHKMNGIWQVVELR